MTRITAPTPTRGPAPSHSPPDMRYAPGGSIAKYLGYFSIGLGLSEIFAHKQLSNMLGIDDKPTLLPLLGMREIASGIGILSGGRPTIPMWSRVAGDAMDLALLGAAMGASNRRGAVAGAMAAVLGVTLMDLLCSLTLTAAEKIEG